MTWGPMNLGDFCYFFSLQVGVIAISCMELTVMCIIFSVNAVEDDPEANEDIRFCHLFVVYGFSILGIITSLFGLFSAYRLSPKLSLVAGCLNVISLVFWLIVLIISFFNDPQTNRYICIENRCADRLFVQDALWRDYGHFGKDRSHNTGETKYRVVHVPEIRGPDTQILVPRKSGNDEDEKSSPQSWIIQNEPLTVNLTNDVEMTTVNDSNSVSSRPKRHSLVKETLAHVYNTGGEIRNSDGRIEVKNSSVTEAGTHNTEKDEGLSNEGGMSLVKPNETIVDQKRNDSKKDKPADQNRDRRFDIQRDICQDQEEACEGQLRTHKNLSIRMSKLEKMTSKELHYYYVMSIICSVFIAVFFFYGTLIYLSYMTELNNKEEED